MIQLNELNPLKTKNFLFFLDYLDLCYQDLTIYFQPIYEAKTFRIFGFEALLRHRYKAINPKELFLKAKEWDLLFELDIFCRRLALQEAAKQNLKDYLFININPESLCRPNYIQGLTDKLAEELNFPKEKIVLEITEEVLVEDETLFLEAISYYRKRGYKVAIDDFGAGWGGPKILSLVEPCFLKIDRYFVQTLENNYISYSFVKYLAELSEALGFSVIAEGIETEDQLKEVKQLGIPLLQGYYLGKPQPEISTSIRKKDG